MTHSNTPPLIKKENPVGTKSFGFIEFSTQEKDSLTKLFTQMGFTPVAQHKTKDITLFRRRDVDFFLNCEVGSRSYKFAQKHGPSISAITFMVENTDEAIKAACQRGAKEVTAADLISPHLRAIEGIGGSILYLVSNCSYRKCIEDDFLPLETPNNTIDQNKFSLHIDHLAHNAYIENLEKWASFYKDIFNFEELYSFDIMGNKTGLKTCILLSPCNNLRIPINIAKGEKSQIQEFLDDYNGEGIQHIAFGCDNIYTTVEILGEKGIQFTSTPSTYFDTLTKNLEGFKIKEPLDKMRTLSILLEFDVTEHPYKKLLQIFTKTLVGPIFFEFIQRKGHEGFGEGNITALFKAMEKEQELRGKL